MHVTIDDVNICDSLECVYLTNGILMKVESIAECSPWSILQYFRPALSETQSSTPYFVFFMSGRLRQVLLYSSFTHAHFPLFAVHGKCVQLKNQMMIKASEKALQVR